ncbi:MAG: DNA cytosine methyltransferase [Sedimentisphaerales bacterium]|nr:DNA cytosine methyltransferase [Sedimentisphaerales bacterium]
MNSNLIAVELFAGAGGLSVGLETAGFNVVLANEIDKDFAETFRLNHPMCRVINDDIHNINFKKAIQELGFSEISLVSGGPPCQGFSTVGSKNRQDPRNSLFYEYLRAVREIEPNYIIFENVSGFKRMYNGEVYHTLIQELDSMGYDTISGILDASDFGLPQIRQRTIVIGWKSGLKPIEWPAATHSPEKTLFGGIPKLTLMDAISDLPPLGDNDRCDIYSSPPLNDYQKRLRGRCQILTEHNSANYGPKMREILSLIPEGGTVDDLPEELRPKSYFKNTYSRLWPNKLCPTITRNFGTPSSSRCVHPYQNRALSTREGARIQSFPDSYIFTGSKTSKNLQIGNAVPPILGEVIGGQIITRIHMKNLSVRHGNIPEVIAG